VVEEQNTDHNRRQKSEGWMGCVGVERWMRKDVCVACAGNLGQKLSTTWFGVISEAGSTRISPTPD
jgi:hypothetical protein